MKTDKVFANIELKSKDKVIEKKTLVDTGAGRSILTKKLADELKAFIPFEKPYELGTASEGDKLRLVGSSVVGVVFEGAEVPGGAMFLVAENLRRDVDVIIGRPEIDSWDIIFTAQGPRPRKVPIEFDII